MAVNLNSLSLTLDQFNAAVSGKYNIGQIKLGEDGTSVYRTNNHKTWTILNTTRIGPEEAWAVKEGTAPTWRPCYVGRAPRPAVKSREATRRWRGNVV